MTLKLVFLAPSIPAVAFFLIVIFGRWLPTRGAFLAPLAVAGSLGVFVYSVGGLVLHGADEHALQWFSVGQGVGRSTFLWGTIADNLSVIMLGLVAFIALAVQLYSWAYMRDGEGNPEPRFAWYYAVHSLFAAAMMALVLSDNLILTYIAWELVGLGSYLLIGFWWERRSAAEAAKKAFVTTRIGDVGLLIGIILLFKATGTFSITTVFAAAEAGAISHTTLNWATGLIFLGAMGKSAQVPLHVWLPDAMEGPTPVSALIHAATMVAAGVYLVARLFPLYVLVPAIMTAVAAIGLTTALVGAFMALVQTDLKRVLAYSTISHLGFMMLALGAGSMGAAMFHLVAHGFAKAALFLGAGAITHATHLTDIRQMGGLRKKMPLTALAFTVAALSLAGIPPLAGFFSKDEILAAVTDGRLNPVFLFGAFVAVAASALYTGRLLILLFVGQPRDEHVYEHAHEAPSLFLGPVLVLASLGAVVGLLAFHWTRHYQGFGYYLTDGIEGAFHFDPVMSAVSVVVVLAALGVTWYLWVSDPLLKRRQATAAAGRAEEAAQPARSQYSIRTPVSGTRFAARQGRRSSVPMLERIKVRLPWMELALQNKLYFDAAYQWCIDRLVVTGAQVIGYFDRAVVNDQGIEGNGEAVRDAGGFLRYLQSGMVYNYALGIAVGAVIAAVLWWAMQ